MTRNVMLCFLQNLTTSKKQQQQGTSMSKKLSTDTKLLEGVTQTTKTLAKSKVDIEKKSGDDKSGKRKKIRTNFFLRKVR